jgi:hypothetical protein
MPRLRGIEFLHGPQKKIPEGWQTFQYVCRWVVGGEKDSPRYQSENRQFHCATPEDATALMSIWKQQGGGVRQYKFLK